MAFHHNTIRAYVAALLDVFNNLEVQNKDSNGNVIVKTIPITYSAKEKSSIVDSYTAEELKSGNYNVLPRSNLALSTMVKSTQRTLNKNNKISKKSTANTFDYQYNSVPYEFTFELNVLCRGMNEATQIAEQICPKFNPIMNIDIWDAQDLDVPTRVPISLLDINIESQEYDEYTTNLFTVSVGLSVLGNLYQPINSINRIKAFKMNINESYTDNTYNKRIIDGWDVLLDGTLLNGTSTQVTDSITYAPVIVDITSVNPIIVGTNNLTLIWKDLDNMFTEMTFEWFIIQGPASITGSTDLAVLNVTGTGTIEVQAKLTDPYGNSTSLSKIYTV